MSTMSNKKLEELLWGAAEFLRGQIDASDYKQGDAANLLI